MDVSKLLETHGDDEPSGENLEYDPAFVEMELAAQPGEERQVGDSIIEADEAEHAEVIKLAEAVLERSHDIRAAVFYAEAALYTRGLIGLADATAFVRGCLEQYWATCHPELDEDDDNDPTMRINAVQGLGGADTVVRALRHTPLTESRMFGQLSMRMIDAAEGTIQAPASMTDVPDAASVSAAFQDTDAEVLKGFFEAASAAQENLKAIDAAFVAHTPGQGPDLEEMHKALGHIVRRLADMVGGEAADAVDGELGDAGGEGAAAGGGGGPRAVGGINSPHDVSNALDRIIGYYQRAEPSSPVPILLERAKRLVGADFLTIVKDMASHGKDQVYTIGGIKEEEDEF